MTAAIKPPSTATTMEVCTAWCTIVSFFSPMACAIVTFAPSAMPMNRLTIRLMIELFVPTAATATVRSSPVKLPMTAMSAALNSWLKIAVAATGTAKRGILSQSVPWSISNEFFCDAAFNSTAPFRNLSGL